MGRKIKGKKHHGTKDPEKQRQVRDARIQMKINNRPSTEDFQELVLGHFLPPGYLQLAWQ